MMRGRVCKVNCSQSVGVVGDYLASVTSFLLSTTGDTYLLPWVVVHLLTNPQGADKVNLR